MRKIHKKAKTEAKKLFKAVKGKVLGSRYQFDRAELQAQGYSRRFMKWLERA